MEDEAKQGMDPIDESKVVLQLVVESTDDGPKVSFKSGIHMALDKAGLIYGAALQSILSAIARISEPMREEHKKILYDSIRSAIDHGGNRVYLRAVVEVRDKEDADGSDMEQGGRDPDRPRDE